MNRRSILKTLLTGGLIPAVPRTAAGLANDPDVVEYKGWTLTWSGWRPVDNQDVIVGWWTVLGGKAENSRYDRIVATTGGSIDPYGPYDCYNMTMREGWPHCSSMSTPSDKFALKHCVRAALQTFLDEKAADLYGVKAQEAEMAKYHFGFTGFKP